MRSNRVLRARGPPVEHPTATSFRKLDVCTPFLSDNPCGAAGAVGAVTGGVAAAGAEEADEVTVFRDSGLTSPALSLPCIDLPAVGSELFSCPDVIPVLMDKSSFSAHEVLALVSLAEQLACLCGHL